jgi:hypothetical protein
MQPSDLNGDGIVDSIDLSILVSRWGSSDATADINNDGTVDALDLSVLVSNWGQTTGSSEDGYFIISYSDLMNRPTSGTAWDSLVSHADKAESESVLLGDQNAYHGPTSALAAALVFARTGNEAYRSAVHGRLALVPDATFIGPDPRALSVGRQLAGYILAANLTGYSTGVWNQYMHDIRTLYIGGHGRWPDLTTTSENTANNWGAFALPSRLAASIFINDETDIAQCAKIFRGICGDRSQWPGLTSTPWDGGFQPTADFQSSWAIGYPEWRPINPDIPEDDRRGAPVEDVGRYGGYPTIHYGYCWEAIQGWVLTAILLSRSGYPDVWTWESNAIRRTVQFMEDNNGLSSSNFHNVNHWVTYAVNKFNSPAVPTPFPAGIGRQMCFTDWLYG